MATLVRRYLATVAVGAVLVVTACDRGAARPTTQPTPTGAPATTTTGGATGGGTGGGSTFDGTWSGAWTRTSPPPGNGTMTLVLHQQGQTISGTVDVTASACLTKGDISGSVTGTAITLHTVTPAVSGGGRATGDYQGTLAGSRITGTLTVSCSLGVGVGTWDVTRQ
jgi:hypothetical protein